MFALPWIFLSFVSTLLVLLIAWIHYKQQFWKNRNIFTPKYNLLFGNVDKVFTQKESLADFTKRIYLIMRNERVKHGGIYMLWTPKYIPIDPEIIKDMMRLFADRGMYYNEEADPLSAHLFSMSGSKWRNLRMKLSPTFTSAKVRMMFNTLVHTGDQLKLVLDENLNAGPINVKETLARFTIDIIGSCAFGIDCNSLKNPDSELYQKSKLFFENDLFQHFKELVSFLAPNLARTLNVTVVHPKLREFFMRTITDTVAYREKNNVFRKDFMHLLLQLKNRGDLYDDDNVVQKDSDTKNKVSITFNELAAQCFAFFLAGFETSSTTMTFALYELASNPDIQEKLRSEVNEVLGRHNREITYEAIIEMHYLEKVINETLRKYPPLPKVQRVCTKEYKVPGTELVLNKGVSVLIPIIGLHYDEEFYPDPETFDPERFSAENVTKRPAFTFLPFGEGPRICIGLRFGMMQTKVGLAVLLKNYKFTLNSKTALPLVMEPKSFIMSVKGGLWMDYTSVN